MSIQSQLGICTASLLDDDLPALVAYCQQHQIRRLELGTGGYPDTGLVDRSQLLASQALREELLERLQQADLHLGALSCHGNPLHPDPIIATRHDDALRETIQLAAELGVKTVVTFSGCGASSQDRTPNWPVIGWPEEFQQSWQQQWERSLVPYWQRAAELADKLEVNIALEMHGGFLVHSPATVMKLREATNARIGVNLDPSHLWWQGIDPLRAIEHLRDCLFHVHLKDTVFNQDALHNWGVLDPRGATDWQQRSWRFGIPGKGHDQPFWQSFLSRLANAGYQGMLSIEHEDPEIAAELGIVQTLAFFRQLEVAAGSGL